MYRGKRQAKRAPAQKKVIRATEAVIEDISVYYLCPIDHKEVERIRINGKPVNRWECRSCGSYYFRHQIIKRKRIIADNSQPDTSGGP